QSPEKMVLIERCSLPSLLLLLDCGRHYSQWQAGRQLGVWAVASFRHGAIAPGRARNRNELPGVLAHIQSQVDDAEGRAVPNLTVGDDRPERSEISPARPHHNLADAISGIGAAVGRLRREALVV